MKRSLRVLVILTIVVTLLLSFVVQAYADTGGQIDLKDILKAISPGLQIILEIVFTALAAAIAYYVRLYLVEIIARLRQNLTYSQFATVRQIIYGLVSAAEQIYRDGKGEEKKQYVLEQARLWLSKYGLDLDLKAIESLIEEAVWNEFNSHPPLFDGPVHTQSVEAEDTS